MPEPVFDAWLKPRQEREPDVQCGRRDCGTSILDPEQDELIRQGFYPDEEGVWTLSRRAARQWAEARRRGVPWSRFALKPRRQNHYDRISRRTARSLAAFSRWNEARSPDADDEWRAPPASFRFRCPVCGSMNNVVAR
jgi:hypothetical protein